MKALKFLLPCLFAFCLSSCIEMTEQITVKKNGSGNFSVNMNMGQVLEMMQSFMPPEELGKLEKGKDTTLQMKDLVDTATTLSPEKKAILRDGSIRMQMSLKEKLFRVDMNFPFKNMDHLPKLYSYIGEGSGMEGMAKTMESKSPASGGPGSDMKQLSSYYDLLVQKNSIARKLNQEKYAKLLQDSSMLQMKQMSEMGGGMAEIKMNTVINLPAKAKKVTGAKAELSADKKTLTLKNSLVDIFEHPEQFEFSVQY